MVKRKKVKRNQMHRCRLSIDLGEGELSEILEFMKARGPGYRSAFAREALQLLYEFRRGRGTVRDQLDFLRAQLKVVERSVTDAATAYEIEARKRFDRVKELQQKIDSLEGQMSSSIVLN